MYVSSKGSGEIASGLSEPSLVPYVIVPKSHKLISYTDTLDKISQHAGKCFMIFCRLLFFFKINLFKNIFQEYHLSVKQIGYNSGLLDPICLQRLYRLLIFCCLLFKKKKSFKNIVRVLTKAQHFDEPDLGPNCLKRLKADITSLLKS